MVMNTTQVGAWAEEIAWQHIRQQGWQLIARNFFAKVESLILLFAKVMFLHLSK